MHWQSKGGNCWQRQMGETEKFLWLIGSSAFPVGKDEWHLFATAKLQFDSRNFIDDKIVADLRTAWQSLRFDHPSIAVVNDGTNLTYNVPDDEALGLWTDETFVVDKSVDDAEFVMANAGPCRQAQLHVLPRSHQIVLHTAHWRSDGRGILHLLHRLLYILTCARSEPLRWGDEVSRLTVCVEDAAEMVDQISSAEQARVKDMATRLLKGAPTLAIPCLGDTHTLPESPRRWRLTWSALRTATLIRACKARNISVTSAVHASIASTNIKRATPDSKALDYRSSIRRDLRARLSEPHNSPASAAALFTTATIVNLPANGTWLDFARRLTDEYRAGYDDELFRLHRVYYRQLVEDIMQAAAEGGGTARAADIDISSIGLVEDLMAREYGRGPDVVKVLEVTASVNSCSRQAAVFVSTFRDCLSLYMSYNKAYHVKEDMESFLKEVSKSLVVELGITD